jgi:hypothetical protein
MLSYLRILPSDLTRENSPELEASIRIWIANAPGVLSVVAIKPHKRGGYAVMIDQVEDLPHGFEDYFQHSEFMLVM